MIYQFEEGNSFFHRLDPLTKFIWLACLSILAIRYEYALAQMLIFVALLLFGMICCHLSLKRIWRAVRIPFWFGVPYFFLQLLFVPGETAILQIGMYTLTIEALDFALAITLRLLSLVLGSVLFIMTTDPRDVVLALTQQFRLPYRFAFAISIALRFLPILQAEADLIKIAHRRRGMVKPRAIKDHFIWWKQFAEAIFTNAVRRVQQMAEAMEVRGYGLYQDRTYLRQLHLLPIGKVMSCLWVGMTVGLLVWF